MRRLNFGLYYITARLFITDDYGNLVALSPNQGAAVYVFASN